MVVTRVQLVAKEILPNLQKACVIAMRYSVIRRQSRLRPRQGTHRLTKADIAACSLTPPLCQSQGAGNKTHTQSAQTLVNLAISVGPLWLPPTPPDQLA
jgi:hypothetical protein